MWNYRNLFGGLLILAGMSLGPDSSGAGNPKT